MTTTSSGTDRRGRRPDRLQVGHVHDDSLEDPPAGNGLKVLLCGLGLSRVAARQVDPGGVAAQGELACGVLADTGIRTRDEHGLADSLVHVLFLPFRRDLAGCILSAAPATAGLTRCTMLFIVGPWQVYASG